MDRQLSWTSSVCLAHLLGGGLALLLAAGRALLLHDRVVDRGALLLVHAVALLLVHSLALSVLHISLKIGAKLDNNSWISFFGQIVDLQLGADLLLDRCALRLACGRALLLVHSLALL